MRIIFYSPGGTISYGLVRTNLYFALREPEAAMGASVGTLSSIIPRQSQVATSGVLV